MGALRDQNFQKSANPALQILQDKIAADNLRLKNLRAAYRFESEAVFFCEISKTPRGRAYEGLLVYKVPQKGERELLGSVIAVESGIFIIGHSILLHNNGFHDFFNRDPHGSLKEAEAYIEKIVEKNTHWRHKPRNPDLPPQHEL